MQIDSIETQLSSSKKLDFLAIISNEKSVWPETVWFKAKFNMEIEVEKGGILPTDTQVEAGIKLEEDSAPMDWLMKCVRPLTREEISL